MASLTKTGNLKQQGREGIRFYLDRDQPSQIWAEDVNGESLSTAWNQGHGADGINQEECRVIRKVGLGVTAKETFRKRT